MQTRRHAGKNRTHLLWAAAIVALAASATFLTYRHTLGFGFYYDDYHFVRPYSPAEVAAAFHGPWDAEGIEHPFYRPLTVAFYALRFKLLGIDAPAHHALSLFLFAVAATMVGALAWRLTGRAAAGSLGAILFVSHPAMPYALVAWSTNQMHLLGTLTVAGGLLWWDACRARTPRWWLPLLALAAAAFMIKEDGIMLLPAVFVLHALRRRLLEPALPPVPRSFLAASVVMMAGLVALRTYALAESSGGYPLPEIARAWANYWQGLDRLVRVVPADREWQPLASAFATLPLLALAARARAAAGARYTMAAGAAIALLFNLPFLFVTKGEQMHLVATGAVLLLTGSALALWTAARAPMSRAAIASALAVGLAAFTAVARDISMDFAPYGPIVRATDTIVREWAAVPAELRAYLADKWTDDGAAQLSTNPAVAVDAVGFGLHPWEAGADGVRYRWMAGSRVDILVGASAQEVVIPLRHEAGAFGAPARAAIASDGRRADAILLEDGHWRTFRMRLRPGDLSPLRQMHRIVLTIDHAWIPAQVVPGSTDTRTLGLQIGEIRVR